MGRSTCKHAHSGEVYLHDQIYCLSKLHMPINYRSNFVYCRVNAPLILD